MRLGLERRNFAAISLQQFADRRFDFARANAVEGGKRGAVQVGIVHFIPRAVSTGAVSGRTLRHSAKASAACSTSMPQPLWARAQPCSMAQVTKGVADLL